MTPGATWAFYGMHEYVLVGSAAARELRDPEESQSHP